MFVFNIVESIKTFQPKYSLGLPKILHTLIFRRTSVFFYLFYLLLLLRYFNAGKEFQDKRKKNCKDKDNSPKNIMNTKNSDSNLSIQH